MIIYSVVFDNSDTVYTEYYESLRDAEHAAEFLAGELLLEKSRNSNDQFYWREGHISVRIEQIVVMPSGGPMSGLIFDALTDTKDLLENACEE